jgi:hypothetical protein
MSFLGPPSKICLKHKVHSTFAIFICRPHWGTSSSVGLWLHHPPFLPLLNPKTAGNRERDDTASLVILFPVPFILSTVHISFLFCYNGIKGKAREDSKSYSDFSLVNQPLEKITKEAIHYLNREKGKCDVLWVTIWHYWLKNSFIISEEQWFFRSMYDWKEKELEADLGLRNSFTCKKRKTVMFKYL